MSARGVEIHNGYISIPAGIQEIEGGTYAAPLEKSVAGFIPAQMAIDMKAISGDALGFYYTVFGDNPSGNLNVIGGRVRAQIKSGIDTGSGYLRGLQVNAEVLAKATVGAAVAGIYVSVYSEAASVFSGDVRGIYINNFMAVSGSTYEMIRLEENGGATVTSLLSGYVGGGGDINYAFIMSGSHTAWDGTTDKVTGKTASGFLRVNVEGYIRHIPLYAP